MLRLAFSCLAALSFLGCAHQPPSPVDANAEPPGAWNGIRTLLARAERDRRAVHVHVQTDRSIYRPGDVVWIRVWNVYLPTFQLASYSHASIAVANRMDVPSTLPNSRGTGLSLRVPRDVPPGRYTVRAGGAAEVMIVNEAPARPGAVEPAVPAIPVAPVGARALELRPEGGTFVAGLESRVYLRATDTDGRPVEVRGTVVDGTGQTVASFESAHAGLGVFTMRPRVGAHYTARAFVRDTPTLAPIEATLPDASADGCVLAAYDAGHTIATKVTCTRDRTLYVAAVQRETLLALMPVRARAGVPQPLSLLPEPEPPNLREAPGLARVTLLSDPQTPLAERVIFRNLQRRLSIDVHFDRANYGPREEATIEVKTRDELGRPIAADVSVAVVDTHVLALAPDFEGHIAADLYLGNEVQSGIAHLEWYFGDAPLPARGGSGYGSGDVRLSRVRLAQGPRPDRRPRQRRRRGARRRLPDRGASVHGHRRHGLSGR